MKIIALAMSLTSLAAPAFAAPPIAGRFVTEDGAAVVEIGRCGDTVCGRIARVLKAKADAPRTDVHNANPALRQRAIVGLPILTGFVDKGNDWRGQIYDPRSGKTYRSIIQRNANGTLKVQGCVAFLCRSQVWRPER